METLLKRDERTFKLVEGDYRAKEFGLIREWHVTEKIHGQNIRIQFDGENVTVAGRKSLNPKDLPADLYKFLIEHFTPELMKQVFDKPVTLFGEGCGPGINGGAAYSATKTFVLFDVLVQKETETWVDQIAIPSIAESLGVKHAPVMGELTTDEVVQLVRKGFYSRLADEITGIGYEAEGIVAVARGLYDHRGSRVAFKLKTIDFRGKEAA
ncbi:MAG TPA: RNA ligase family protein [Oculatellaceae cyanobacterium]